MERIKPHLAVVSLGLQAEGVKGWAVAAVVAVAAGLSAARVSSPVVVVRRPARDLMAEMRGLSSVAAVMALG